MYPYTYTLLRYVHDTATGEFVNVGVVVHCPSAKFVGAKCRKTFGRVAKVFPGVNGESFKASMRFIERRVASISDRVAKELCLDSGQNAVEFATSVLPHDASSLQWSPIGSGLTKDPAATLDKLFQRMVARYDDKHLAERRGDDDVWRTFKRDLEARRLSELFVPKVIEANDDSVEFEHAWKNGVWHCLAPVSFDLSSPETIREKAYRWLGQMTSIKDTSEKLKIYLLLGQPQQAGLETAFHSALSILDKIPIDKEIYREDQSASFIGKIAEEVRVHFSEQEQSI